jgi:hypothetical protein
MNVEIGAEAGQFPEKECINGIFVAVWELQTTIKKHRLLYHACLFQAYHQAHLEAIKGFGMHGYEIEFESLVEEYQVL